MKRSFLGLVLVLAIALNLGCGAYAGGYEEVMGEIYFFTSASVNGQAWLVVQENGQTLMRLDSEAVCKFNRLTSGEAFRSESYLERSEIESALAVVDENGNVIPKAELNAAVLVSGERLLAIDPFNGIIFEIQQKNQQLEYTRVAQGIDFSFLMDANDEDYQVIMMPNATVEAGGKVYLALQNWQAENDYYQLWSVDLASGQTQRLPLQDVEWICAMPDGRLMVIYYPDSIRYNEQTDEAVYPTAAVMDGESGKIVQTLGRLSCPLYASPVWNAHMNGLMYYGSNRLMMMDLSGKSKQVGYSTLGWCHGMFMIGDDVFLTSGETHVFVKPKSDFNSDNKLLIYGSYMNEGATEYAKLHPDVQLYFSEEYYQTQEQINQAMVSGENQIDILTMGVEYSAFTNLMEKGYCLDLSDYSALTEVMEDVYPHFSSAVMKNGKLMAIPVNAYGTGMFYSSERLNAMGLTEEDLPHTMAELCRFVTWWNNEMAEEYPEVRLFYTNEIRNLLLQEIIRMWMVVCSERGEEIRFDTPEVREVLQAWEEMETDLIEENMLLNQGNEEYEWQDPLFMDSYITIGDAGWMDGKRNWVTFLDLKFNDQTPVLYPCNVSVMFINPRSKNIQQAVNYLVSQLENLRPNERLSLMSSMKDPVEWAYYQGYIQEINELVEELTGQLEQAKEPETREAIQEMIESYKIILENEQDRWQISPQAIEYYQQHVVPATVVMQQSPFASFDDKENEIEVLIERYVAKQINMDQCLREIDNKLRMMRLENN